MEHRGAFWDEALSDDHVKSEVPEALLTSPGVHVIGFAEVCPRYLLGEDNYQIHVLHHGNITGCTAFPGAGTQVCNTMQT